MTRRIGLVTVAAVLMLGFVGGWVSAQSVAVKPTAPTVLSGANVGFRVEGYRGSVPVGKLVIQVDGRWVEPDFSSGVRRLTSR
jgi:hypothetical protein